MSNKHAQCFDSILSFVETHDWNPATSLPVDEIVEGLSGDFAPWVVEHVLRLYSSAGVRGTAATVGLHVRRVQIFRARQLLAGGEEHGVADIAARWADSLPANVAAATEKAAMEGNASPDADVEELQRQAFTSLVHSAALALVEHNQTRGEMVCAKFFRSELARVPAERFRQLFQRRAQWLKDDLVSYISDLQQPGLSVDSMLLKFTRATSSTEKGGAAMYTCR